MDALTQVLVPRFRSRALTASLLTGLCALLAVPAMAGPLDPAHRFERIGGGVADATAVLPVPGEMRALILQRTGELRLVTGDGLVDEVLGTVPVRSECPEKGLLSAVWAPGAEGRTLYATYVSSSTGFFTVGRIGFDDAMRPSDPEVVWQATFPAPCDNLGGGIAFAADGTLLVGTGDFGNPGGAGQITSPVGKILRFTAEGFPPSDPLEPNPFGASPTYSMGVRNPVRLMADVETGDVWFLDLGPGDNDELNLVRRQINYGWNASMLMGHLELEGDPYHVWSPAVGPTGLNPYRGDNFKADLNVMVSASDGILSEVVPDLANQVNSVETILFIPDAEHPQVAKDLTVFPDGMVYIIGEDGSLWRLKNDAAPPHEPSGAESVVPTLVQRTGPDEITFAADRAAGAEFYGLYVGDLMTLAADGYNHGTDENGDGEPNETTDFRSLDASTGDAWARFSVGVSELSPDRNLPETGPDGRTGLYFLLSGDSSRLETGVGLDSFKQVRPGGNLIKTCQDGCDSAGYGTADGECMEETILDTTYQDPEGDGSVANLGTMEATEVGDCKVTLLLLGAEWCPPCQLEAPHVQGLVEEYGADRLEVISVMHEDRNSQPADEAAVLRWIEAYSLTYKVVADPSASVIINWNGCGGIPQSYLFDEQGKQVDFFCGYNAAALDAAVEAEMTN